MQDSHEDEQVTIEELEDDIDTLSDDEQAEFESLEEDKKRRSRQVTATLSSDLKNAFDEVVDKEHWLNGAELIRELIRQYVVAYEQRKARRVLSALLEMNKISVQDILEASVS